MASTVAQRADEIEIRSLQGAGLAALSMLPLLLLGSLTLEIPLAWPALIASGYLGIAFAASCGWPRQAALLNGIVLAGLVVWPILCFTSEDITFGWSVLAALLAPLFAAGPSLARLTIKPRRDSSFPTCSKMEGSSIEAFEETRFNAPARGQQSAAAIRMAPQQGRPDSAARCDVDSAVAFALRHARPLAEARHIGLTIDAEAGAIVACDSQTCRRILRMLLECAIMISTVPGEVSLSARKVRGVALLRVQSPLDGDQSEARAPGENRQQGRASRLATARILIEGAGGTLVAHQSADGMSLSARLDLAVDGVEGSKEQERRGIAV